MAVDRLKIPAQVLIDCWHSTRSAALIAQDLGIVIGNLRARWIALKRQGKLPTTGKMRSADRVGKSYQYRAVQDHSPGDSVDGRVRVSEQNNRLFLKLLRLEAKR